MLGRVNSSSHTLAYIEPQDLAEQRRALVPGEITMPGYEVEVTIANTRLDQDLPNMALVGIQLVGPGQTHGKDPPHFRWSSMMMA